VVEVQEDAWKSSQPFDSFTLSNDHFKVHGKKIRIVRLGYVLMHEELSFAVKFLWATISKTADVWQVSISAETEDASSPSLASNQIVGIHLGITHLATLCTGETLANPNAL